MQIMQNANKKREKFMSLCSCDVPPLRGIEVSLPQRECTLSWVLLVVSFFQDISSLISQT